MRFEERVVFTAVLLFGELDGFFEFLLIRKTVLSPSNLVRCVFIVLLLDKKNIRDRPQLIAQ